jgi:hypothetical protein
MRFYRTWDGGTANLPQGLPPAYPSPAFPDLGLLGAIRSYSELFGLQKLLSAHPQLPGSEPIGVQEVKNASVASPVSNLRNFQCSNPDQK